MLLAQAGKDGKSPFLLKEFNFDIASMFFSSKENIFVKWAFVKVHIFCNNSLSKILNILAWVVFVIFVGMNCFRFQQLSVKPAPNSKQEPHM